MGLFDKLFNKNSGADPKVTAACDSDIFENIDKIINEDRSNFDKVIKYLTDSAIIPNTEGLSWYTKLIPKIFISPFPSSGVLSNLHSFTVPSGFFIPKTET